MWEGDDGLSSVQHQTERGKHRLESQALLSAAACNDADTTQWNADSGHVQWQEDMSSCGLHCLGEGTCVTSCLAEKGWTSSCATCFGDLTDCTRANCLVECLGVRSPGCVSCLEAKGCNKKAFGAGSCTGFVY